MREQLSRNIGLTLLLAAFAVTVSGCFQTVGAADDTTTPLSLPTLTATLGNPVPTNSPQPTIAPTNAQSASIAVAQAPTTDESNLNPGANDVQSTLNAQATALILGITQTAAANNTLLATVAQQPPAQPTTAGQPVNPNPPTATPIPAQPGQPAQPTPEGTVGAAGSGAAGPITADCIYTVVEGDRLFRIGLRFGLTTEAVARANGIVNPDLILPDQKFRIPNCNATPIPPGAVNPNVAASGSAGGKVYVVQEGDTLYAIATRFGVKIRAIAEANNIANISLIYIGQQLTIP
jgi:LysM repeat protein